MKIKPTIIIVLLFLSVQISAQSWSPFPVHQKSIFESSGVDGEIFQYHVDSAIFAINNSKFFFDKKSSAWATCDIIESPGLIYYNSAHHPDTLHWDGEKYYLNYKKMMFGTFEERLHFFVFYPNCEPEFSWQIDNIGENEELSLEITCDSAYQKTVFNQLDSVKNFKFKLTENGQPYPANLNSFEIELSKEFGFLSFINLDNLVKETGEYELLTLIGINKNGIDYGEVLPQFEDYFHLSPGDMLFYEWDQGIMELKTPEFTYFMDSITNVISTPDSVIYTFNRISPQYTGLQGLTYKFKKSELNPMFQHSPNFYYFSQDYPGGFPVNGVTRIGGIYQNSEFNDSSIRRQFIYNYGMLNPSNCAYNFTSDGLFTEIFNTTQGLESYGYYSTQGNDYKKSIGSIINGVHNGITELQGVDEEVTSAFPILFPQPSGDKLYIRNLANDNYIFSIFTISGKEVSQGRFEGSIDVSGITPGIYMLKIVGDRKAYNFKCILK